MPLTIAHPAAVIPLFRRMKKYGVLSALIIGSLVPDFRYFLFLPISWEQTHSILGIFWFCLPMGLLTYFIFHGFMKRPLLSLLSDQITSRFLQNKNISLPDSVQFMTICFSIFVGVITHLIWDSFTHKNGFMVLTYPFLSINLFTLSGYEVYVFKILQHGSTFFGIGLLLYWIFQWYRESGIATMFTKVTLFPLKQGVIVIGFIFFTAAAVGLLTGFYFSRYETGIFALREFARNFVVNAGSTVGGLLLIYSLFWHLMKISKHRQEIK